jgi:hypothetical protein
MIKSIGLPYAYFQFPKNTGQAPPFILFFYSQQDDLFADDTNYQKIAKLNIELYTKEKDFTQEEAVENVLQFYGFSYYKEENYIDTEQMFQIAYEMEVIING